MVQVSRILGHASASTTLDIYAHMFDHARHGADLRGRISASAFLSLLDQTTRTPERTINVIEFPSRKHTPPGDPTGRCPAANPKPPPRAPKALRRRMTRSIIPIASARAPLCPRCSAPRCIAGATKTLTVNVKPDTHTFFCSVPGTAPRERKETLTVR